MERKFLAFSCLVLLSSIVYFIYTSYQLHIENKNQQELTAKLKVPSVERVYTNNSSQSSKTERSTPELTEEEWEAFNKVLSHSEGSENQAETIQLDERTATEASETEGDGTKISPEQVARFEFISQYQEMQRDSLSVDDEFSELTRKQIQLGSDITAGPMHMDELGVLVWEHKRVSERLKVLEPLITSHVDQTIQMEAEFQEKYGASLGEFYNQYEKEYKSWKAGL